MGQPATDGVYPPRDLADFAGVARGLDRRRQTIGTGVGMVRPTGLFVDCHSCIFRVHF